MVRGVVSLISYFQVIWLMSQIMVDPLVCRVFINCYSSVQQILIQWNPWKGMLVMLQCHSDQKSRLKKSMVALEGLLSCGSGSRGSRLLGVGVEQMKEPESMRTMSLSFKTYLKISLHPADCKVLYPFSCQMKSTLVVFPKWVSTLFLVSK